MADQRVQRRLAAILAADVVGYSPMMEPDEEGTLARMKALRNDLIDPNILEYRRLGSYWMHSGNTYLNLP